MSAAAVFVNSGVRIRNHIGYILSLFRRAPRYRVLFFGVCLLLRVRAANLYYSGGHFGDFGGLLLAPRPVELAPTSKFSAAALKARPYLFFLTPPS